MTKQISVTGVNTQEETIVLADKLGIENAEQIHRRIAVCRDKGADKIVIVLPCGSVFDRNVSTLNQLSINSFVNQVFRTLGA